MNGGKESKRLLRDLDTWRNKDSILYTAPSNSISLANIKMLEFKVSAFVAKQFRNFVTEKNPMRHET